MNHCIIKNWTSTLLLFMFYGGLIAQYSGGDGDGAQKSSVVIQITLNGAPINTVGLYRGGDGDGHDKQSNIVTLNGDKITSLYIGGDGDGHDKKNYTATLDGAEIAQLYRGGNGDGQDKNLFIGVLNGQMLSGLYSGGNGDGHNKEGFPGTLSGAEIAQLYRGGNGDGQDKNLFIGVLNGQMLSGLYSGGNGDGHNKDDFIGVLNGQELSALYSGGIGDGFSKHMIQYIFDFPGCNIVVNTDDDGFGSLRYAINCASPGDTIEFSPFLMQDSIVLTSSSLDITKDLYINGIKTAELTIDGSQLDRVFKLGSNVATIKGLRIIVGTNPSGGAVLSNGMLTLMDVEIYDPTGNATTVIETTVGGSLTIKGEVKVLNN